MENIIHFANAPNYALVSNLQPGITTPQHDNDTAKRSRRDCACGAKNFTLLLVTTLKLFYTTIFIIYVFNIKFYLIV
jgi:hypothetical protein